MKMIRRPDVTVSCGEPRDDVYEAEDPKMVAEILSPSNKGIGWQRKLEEYRHLTGLQYILLVETGAVGATLLAREPAGDWGPSDYDTLADVIELPAIGCRLPMAEVYEGVRFGAVG
jgi:Uma2 family endonuclease